MRLLPLLLLLVPAAAHAAPLFAAVAAWAGAVGAVGAVGAMAVVDTVITIVSLASSVYGAVASRRKAKHALADQRAAYNASLTERSITAVNAAPPWRVIYGEAIVGGDIVAMFTSDKTGYRESGATYTKPDALKHLVIHVASHEVEDIVEMYIDGVAIGAVDGDGWATSGEFYRASKPGFRSTTIGGGGYVDVSPAVVSILTATYLQGTGLDQYAVDFTPTLSNGNTRISGTVGGVVGYTISTSSGTVRWTKHLGSSSQTVDTYLNSVKPSQWTANHRLRGRAYVTVTLDLEEPRFQAGPPQITFKVKGKKLYDPRTSLTTYSKNPALCIRDYITAPYGLGCSAAEVDDASVIAAANACDADITFLWTVNGASADFVGDKYTCNGVIISEGHNKEQTLDALCMSMAGTASYGAAWTLHAGVWAAPVMTLNDDDLHGQIEVVQAGAAIDDLFNGVRAQHVPAGSATAIDVQPYQNSTFITDDGQELWADVAFPFTDNPARVRNICRILVERNRQSLVIKYPAKLKAWPVQVGDRVTVNSAEYGFSSKTFRVTDWNFSLHGAVVLTLQEDVAEVYDQADAAISDEAPNTTLPSPWSVAAITGLTCTSDDTTAIFGSGNRIIPRVKVSWTQAASPYVKEAGGKIEVSWRRVTDTWSTQDEPGDSTSTYITGPNNGDRIVVSVRARNSFGQWSDPAYASCTVSGALRIVEVKDRSGNVILGDGSQLPASFASRDGFFEDFQSNAALAMWENINGGGELTLVTVSDGEGGGLALRVGNNSGNDQAWLVHKGLIPHDQNSLYRFTVRVRRLSGSGLFYAGFAGLAADGVTLVNIYGDNSHSIQHYVCAAAYSPGSTWVTYAGYIKGRAATGGTASANPDSPAQVHNDVRWMRPLLLCGYNGEPGQYEVDYYKIERVDDWRDAMLTAEAAQATADGKIETFWQTSAPGSASEGDIWFDTDDGYKQYRWTSGAWVVAADTRIGTAIADAAAAQATADGKVVTFVQTSTPTAEGVGDLWFDSDDGYKLYRWNGSSWVAYQYGTSALAAGSAADVQTTITDDDYTKTWAPSYPSSDTRTVTDWSWTNNTGRAATVEINYRSRCTLYWTGSGSYSFSSQHSLEVRIDSALQVGPTAVIGVSPLLTSSSTSASLYTNHATSVSVAAGSTLNVKDTVGLYQSNAVSGCTARLVTAGATLRATVVKA